MIGNNHEKKYLTTFCVLSLKFLLMVLIETLMLTAFLWALNASSSFPIALLVIAVDGWLGNILHRRLWDNLFVDIEVSKPGKLLLLILSLILALLGAGYLYAGSFTAFLPKSAESLPPEHWKNFKLTI